MKGMFILTVFWVHPRACGENECISIWRSLKQGSSPRVRGKLLSALQFAPAHRLIPARAGKTVPPNLVSSAMQAHPRTRGENRDLLQLHWELKGSSPHARGKRILTLCFWHWSRLIPARAGKTPNKSRIYVLSILFRPYFRSLSSLFSFFNRRKSAAHESLVAGARSSIWNVNRLCANTP